jgi:MFS family permease
MLSLESKARGLIWALFELDRPLREQTDEEIVELVEDQYRWNFGVNLADGTAWWLGVSFISAATVIPLFVSKLTTSTVAIGYVAMLAAAGWFLPQIFTSNWVERLPRRKPVVVYVGLIAERLPVLLMVFAAVLAGRWAAGALALFLFAYTWHRFGGGVVATAWQDLIARVIPVDRRGLFWGLTSALGAAAGFAGALLSAGLLANYPFPVNFIILFALAGVILLLGWGFTLLIREPAQEVREARRSQRDYLAQLPGLVREDRPFRRFLAARLLLTFGTMGLGFVTVAAVQQWAVPDGTVGLYTAVMLLGMTVANLAFGLLGDRHGHKQSLEWAAGAYTLAFALAWLAPEPVWYFLVFFLLGVGQGILVVSGILVVLEFSEPVRRPTYAGITNSSLGVVGTLGPLVGAWLASAGFGLLFAFSAVLSLVAFVAMRWWVPEPRWASRP